MRVPTLYVGHVEAFADRDECSFGSGVEIKERVPAERLDQPNRKRDAAIAAERDRRRAPAGCRAWATPRLRRPEAVRQSELEARAAKPPDPVRSHNLAGEQVLSTVSRRNRRRNS